MDKKTIAVAAISLVSVLLIVSILRLRSEDDSGSQRPLEARITYPTISPDVAEKNGDRIDASPTARSVILVRDWRSFSRGKVPSERNDFPPDPIEASGRYAHFETLAINGSAAAALALDQLMIYCFGSASSSGAIKVDTDVLPECRNLPPSAKEQPQRWLLMAARLGDVNGLTQLLGAAADVTRRGDTSRAAVLSGEAIATLENAAINGEPAAYQLLTSAYYQGVLFPSNPIKAFAYADIYAKMTGDSFDQSVADKIARSLKTADWLAVETLQSQLFVNSQKAQTLAAASSGPK